MLLIALILAPSTSSFHQLPTLLMNNKQKSDRWTSSKEVSRRSSLHALGGGGGFVASSFFNNLFNNNDVANAAGNYKSKGPTNEVIKVVEGMRWKRMGGSDIIASEMVRTIIFL